MSHKRMLEQTNDFIRLYLHTTGDTEVPRQYHLWSCISMIAALLSNRCGYRKFREKLLRPNLYVILLGPPGIGKGEAVGKVHRLIQRTPSINLFNGKITGPRLLDKMGNKQQNDAGQYEIRDSITYLTTEELAFAFGSGNRAEDLIMTLTQLWGGSDVPIEEGTRQHGDIMLVNPCVNWLAGSTLTWFLKSITTESVLSGFFSRCIVVDAHYDYTKRRYHPTYPPDYDEVMEHLYNLVAWFAQASGEFKMTDEADSLDRIWYDTREEPDNEEAAGDWRREHDMVLKLAMVFSISSRYDEYLITKDHITKAHEFMAGLKSVKSSIRITSTKAVGANELEKVETAIRKAGEYGIAGTLLLRRMGTKYGMMKTEFDECLETLRRRDDIELLSNPKGAVFYRWKKRRGN